VSSPNPVALELQADPPIPSDAEGEHALKIILLGDSAVGKSKLIERFLVKHPLSLELS
jgi:GTPase SAR1 family protein